nr:LysM peptidoglycan-binding domain-containing protein [Bacteroidota bacterium]
ELDGYREIKEGNIIYLQPKRNKSDNKFHIVKEGENLRSISQKYAMKLSKVCAYNFLEPESLIHPGDKIYLRKQRN